MSLDTYLGSLFKFRPQNNLQESVLQTNLTTVLLDTQHKITFHFRIGTTLNNHFQEKLPTLIIIGIINTKNCATKLQWEVTLLI